MLYSSSIRFGMTPILPGGRKSAVKPIYISDYIFRTVCERDKCLRARTYMACVASVYVVSLVDITRFTSIPADWLNNL